MSLTNIDGLLTQVENAQPGLVPEPMPLMNNINADIEPEGGEPAYLEPIGASSAEDVAEAAETTAQDTDDYGTEIPKQEKVYTQAEVDARINEAIRRRLKEKAEQPVQQPIQQQPQQQQQFEYDASAGDSWEVQLESFIENTLTKREQKQQQQQWQQQEQDTQANFEIKFNTGAAKYADFESTVLGKAITPQMVIATRGMDDPAAFIYAAAKTQAPELERISKIYDPYAQAIELGRLEERMRKARGSASKAPRPIEQPRGDVSEKVERKWSIDDKLRQSEAEARKDRMRGRTQ